MAGDAVAHMAPPADRVPVLIEDGNGRTGRLWQTLILSRWRSVFGFLPIETTVHGSQEDHYRALQAGNAAGDSARFVEFMLQMVLTTFQELESTGPNEQVAEQATEQVLRLLAALADEPRSTKARMERLGLSHRPRPRRVSARAGPDALLHLVPSTSRRLACMRCAPRRHGRPKWNGLARDR
jgi:hypothetical protein